MLRALTASIVLLAAAQARAQSTNEAVCWISAGGSGTLIGTTADGTKALVISCNHVCEDAPIVNCTFKNVPQLAAKKFPGRVVELDSRHDLAAVLIYNPGIPPVVIGDFQRHDGIYSACGYGGGRYSAARGRIFRMDANTTWTRCGIYPGHSGGGLFDPYGCYCGVTNWNNGSDGPNPSGFSRSRSGAALQAFICKATRECGILSRWRNRHANSGGGDQLCPPGGCPNPNTPSLDGGGYGLAPGYQNITAPQAAPLVAQAPVVTAPAQPAAVAQPIQLATTPPAIAVQPATPLAVRPLEPAAPAQQPLAQPDPVADYARTLEAALAAKRSQLAAERAMAAYEQALAQPAPQGLPMQSDPRLEAILTAIERQLGVARDEPRRGEPSQLVDHLPVVTMTVEYHDRTETAELDLAAFVRQQFGATNEKEK